MKSAEEWSKEWQKKEGFSGYEVLPDIEMIKQIQQDAYSSGFVSAIKATTASLTKGPHERKIR